MTSSTIFIHPVETSGCKLTYLAGSFLQRNSG